MRYYGELVTIEPEQVETGEAEQSFAPAVQSALLLALREKQILTEYQYRCAETLLRGRLSRKSDPRGEAL